MNEEIIVGVPLISPVELSRVIPVGKAGLIDHVSTVPPLYVGVTEIIEVPLVSVNDVVLYETPDGLMSLTVMSIFVESLPPVLLA